ncbi:hypothetical protein G6F45_013772 [Rhizopus arrhizus]|nr:hypothetical protein G6F45_013772 [Rhizopus arrhizus]
MIQRLTNELAAARSEIEQLRATTVQLQNQLNQVHPTTNQPTSTLTANVQSSLDFPELTTVSTPWRNPEQTSTTPGGCCKTSTITIREPGLSVSLPSDQGASSCWTTTISTA